MAENSLTRVGSELAAAIIKATDGIDASLLGAHHRIAPRHKAPEDLLTPDHGLSRVPASQLRSVKGRRACKHVGSTLLVWNVERSKPVPPAKMYKMGKKGASPFEAAVGEKRCQTLSWNIIVLRVALIMASLAAWLTWWYGLTFTVIISTTLNLGRSYARGNMASDTLEPFTFAPLPLGSIKPQGWLRDQMQLMADGLAGHEMDFYRYVAQSSWLGGNQEYSALNEGFPYWFNGLVPLAYGLDDTRLKQQVQDAVNYVISHQAADGWIGPEQGNARNFWARYPFFLGLMNLVEADSSYEGLVLPAMHKFVDLMHSMLADNYTGYLYKSGDAVSEDDTGWGRVRVPDLMITLEWLYERDPGNQTNTIMESLQYLQDGALDWAYWWRDDVFIKTDLNLQPEDTLPPFPYLHGVNVGQGLKAGAVVRRFTHNDSLIDMNRRAVDWTFRYHGSASGTILADERLQGLGPFYGSELCMTVETMYSMSYLYQAIGDNIFADHCENAAFNALPVQVTADHWAHQYVTQPNQPYSKILNDTPFWNVNPYGQTYGLEPNYPCCTVNHPQGYPKFLAATFTRSGDDGLVHALLSPAEVSTTLPNGADVKVACDTAYPFSYTLSYNITASAPFTFYIRAPGWASSSSFSLSINGEQKNSHPAYDSRTGLNGISITTGTTSLTYTLQPGGIVAEPRANDTVAVRQGPILYALAINSSTTSGPAKKYNTHEILPNIPPEAKDYIITNTSAWNVAIDASTLKFNTKLAAGKTGLANPLWTPGGPPTSISVKACLIDWPIWKGVPGPVPSLSERKCLGEPFDARLVPYGSAKVHMAELPTVDLEGA